ncbi:hypothetical protein F2Q69_00012594 [Brassica cretica]|uniref:Uncharacterized protein n=1 Tax=Brassica cretica TaxID=69181 RepID=A0A8S9QUM2_BRACR|nr:hypothetical protein F2Q69_00012594 [Brassica cretica]
MGQQVKWLQTMKAPTLSGTMVSGATTTETMVIKRRTANWSTAWSSRRHLGVFGAQKRCKGDHWTSRALGATLPERHRQVALTCLIRATLQERRGEVARVFIAWRHKNRPGATSRNDPSRPIPNLGATSRSDYWRESIVGARISSECEGSLQLGATSSERHSEVARVFAVFGHEIDLAATFRSDTISNLLERAHEVAPAGSDVFGATQPGRSRFHRITTRKNEPGAASRSDTIKSLPSWSSFHLQSSSTYPFPSFEFFRESFILGADWLWDTEDFSTANLGCKEGKRAGEEQGKSVAAATDEESGDESADEQAPTKRAKMSKGKEVAVDRDRVKTPSVE